MKYSQAKQGRIFVIRLEHGDIVHKEIERFARNQSMDLVIFHINVLRTENGPLRPFDRIFFFLSPWDHV